MERRRLIPEAVKVKNILDRKESGIKINTIPVILESRYGSNEGSICSTLLGEETDWKHDNVFNNIINAIITPLNLNWGYSNV